MCFKQVFVRKGLFSLMVSPPGSRGYMNFGLGRTTLNFLPYMFCGYLKKTKLKLHNFIYFNYNFKSFRSYGVTSSTLSKEPKEYLYTTFLGYIITYRPQTRYISLMQRILDSIQFPCTPTPMLFTVPVSLMCFREIF